MCLSLCLRGGLEGTESTEQDGPVRDNIQILSITAASLLVTATLAANKTTTSSSHG